MLGHPGAGFTPAECCALLCRGPVHPGHPGHSGHTAAPAVEPDPKGLRHANALCMSAMRMGADALVFSKAQGLLSVGMLYGNAPLKRTAAFGHQFLSYPPAPPPPILCLVFQPYAPQF